MSHVTFEFSFPAVTKRPSSKHDCKQHFSQDSRRRLNASQASVLLSFYFFCFSFLSLLTTRFMAMESTAEFPQGFFFIRCKSQPFAVDVNGGSMTVSCIHCSVLPRISCQVADNRMMRPSSSGHR